MTNLNVKSTGYFAKNTVVQVVNICDLLDAVAPNWLDNYNYDANSAKVFEWCEANNAHYYAADREYFSKIEAAWQAEEAGKKIVVVEDLS
jgi:hypothetical protein